MLGPKKRIMWAKHLPLPFNPYPSFKTQNLTLGKEARPLALYVPLLLVQKNVKEVDKHQGKLANGGVDLSLVKAKDLRGSGLSSFQHPVKVAARHCCHLKNIYSFNDRFQGLS